MPKALLVWTEYRCFDEDGSQHLIREAATEFEEITDEELQTLQSNIYRLKHPRGWTATLIIKDEQGIQAHLTTIRANLDKIEADRQAAVKRNQKAVEAKKAKQAEAELKKYEALKKKFEGVKE